MSKQIQYQLQFYDAKKKAYEPAPTLTVEPHSKDHRDLAETAAIAAKGRPWRICRTDRPLNTPAYLMPESNGNRPVENVVKDYLTWAISQGLTHITCYERHRPLLSRAPFWYGKVTYTTPKEQFAVDVSHDEDTP